jgi:hypothetical protein
MVLQSAGRAILQDNGMAPLAPTGDREALLGAVVNCNAQAATAAVARRLSLPASPPILPVFLPAVLPPSLGHQPMPLPALFHPVAGPALPVLNLLERCPQLPLTQ